MLSYLLLLSTWAAYGINNSLRSSFLEELAPESTSDSLTLEGVEDDSSQPILAQTEGYTWVYESKDKVETDGYFKVTEDASYSEDQYWTAKKDARHNFAACGIKGKVYLSYPQVLAGLEIIYCNKNKWNEQYSDIFDLDPESELKYSQYTRRSAHQAVWKEVNMCSYDGFIYGFWGVQDKDSAAALIDFGFYCTNGGNQYVLYSTKWEHETHNSFKQYYYNSERICGFQAQISTPNNVKKNAQPGVEGFKVRKC